jgi:hypothetical protein
VTRWVKLFREGRDAIQESRRSGRPHIDSHTIQLLASLLEVNRQWAARELVAENRASHSARYSWIPEIAARWVPHTMSECNNGNVMRNHLRPALRRKR